MNSTYKFKNIDARKAAEAAVNAAQAMVSLANIPTEERAAHIHRHKADYLAAEARLLRSHFEKMRPEAKRRAQKRIDELAMELIQHVSLEPK
jgi:hypothetical protein